MQLLIDLPDDVAVELQEKWRDLPQHMLETLAVQDYRSGELTAYQARRLLGYETPMEYDELLQRWSVYLPLTESDLEADVAASRAVSAGGPTVSK